MVILAIEIFLLFGVDGLGDLHQDKLALTAIFGIQAHHGFGCGAAASEKI